MTKYRASIQMEFEPDKNGYLEWEYAYEMTDAELEEEGYKPRTQEEMERFFADELWEYILENAEFDSIYVEKLEE